MQLQGQPAKGLGNGGAEDFKEPTFAMEAQNKEGGPENTTSPPKKQWRAKDPSKWRWT